MKFEEALKAMREGKKVARQGWEIVLGKPVHQCILDGKLMHYTGITYYSFPIAGRDILAEDWEVVDD